MSATRVVGDPRDAPVRVRGRVLRGWAIALLIVAAGVPSAEVQAADVGPQLLRLDQGSVAGLPQGLLDRDPRDVRPSPDGRMIAFVGVDSDHPDAPHRLFVARVDGQRLDPVRAVGSIGPALPADPAWSADGRRIVYRDVDGLIVVDVDTGKSRRIHRARGSRLWLPSFRPDGREILYTRVADHGRHLELWTVPVRGGRARRLVPDAAFGSWSPDGSTIAFRRFGRAVRPGSIWPYAFGQVNLADADGRRIRRLVSRRSGWMMAPLDWSGVRPVWSPDGTRLTYTSFPMYGRHGNPVRVVEVDSGNVIQVGCGEMPVWWDARTLMIDRLEPCGGTST
jgi:Tol biopolymer transport system component